MEEGIFTREDKDSNRINLEKVGSGLVKDSGITTRLDSNKTLLLVYFIID